MTTRRDILRTIAAPLVELYGEREARSIALLAASELSGLPEAAFLTDPQAAVEIDGLDAAVERLAAGCPVQYVTGRAQFFGRKFAMRDGVLIPRPETEELVAWILRTERDAAAILDVGTGSGCIAATLAAKLPRAKVSAADISPAALAVAAENCRTLGAKVDLRQADALSDLAEVFAGPFDVIVSNPPYVPQRDRATMHLNVRDYEPPEALFVPDDDPLLFYRAIARAGRKMLRTGGRLYFEIYHLHADALCALLAEEGYTGIELRNDLFGKNRMLCSRKS
ncbi:MAG: peptide chain release factor N(5)-glutamine methyltransferase [Alistipes senegalensis]|nr:peptide chain release factor N(5)-glutamine methyltransferase [Bacteroides cellulosilyticus]MCM1352673.1 peptide chain release factor N(5)-glutamine methyltransferase [Alistipes senegalensis]